MKHSILARSVVALCLAAATSALAASAASPTPATKCLNDLRAFNHQMEKDGYWLTGSGYGYPMDGSAIPSASGYKNERPGYEVRALSAAANILARQGKQQACESVLAATHDIYNSYLGRMRNEGVPTADMPRWRQQQILMARPIATDEMSFRSDQLLGSDVRTPLDVPLGAVDDLVTNPQTGKIAYVVIARGGIFGLDSTYVPVPWADFKVNPYGTLLVLDTTVAIMKDAPQVSDADFEILGQFDRESAKVDAYWQTHLPATSK